MTETRLPQTPSSDLDQARAALDNLSQALLHLSDSESRRNTGWALQALGEVERQVRSLIPAIAAEAALQGFSDEEIVARLSGAVR